jgi:hypothetical protein
MISTAKKFLLFFVVSSLFGCTFYFAWAWSKGLAENTALRTQVATLADQSKNTEAAIAVLRAKDESLAKARELESKNELNWKEQYLKSQEQVRKLEKDFTAQQTGSLNAKKTLRDALKRAEKAEKELKDKETIIASQWRRIERLETRGKSLDQENQNMQLEVKRQRESEKLEALQKVKQDANEGALRDQKKLSQEIQAKEKEFQKALKQKDEAIRELTVELHKSRENENRLKAELKKSGEKKEKPQKEFREWNAKVQELSQDAATAHYNLGVLYMRSGQHKNAVAEFKYALATNPSDASAHYNLAVILDAFLGDPKGAVEHYEAYMRLQPKAEDFQKVQYRVFKMRLQDTKGVGKDLGLQS